MLVFGNGFKLTSKGKQMVSSGASYSFSKIVLGAGTYTSAEDATVRTGLKSQKQTFDVSNTAIEGTTVTIAGVITNASLSEGYTITEAGVIAKDSSGIEHLFLIGVATLSDPMPAHSDNIPDVICDMKIKYTTSNTSKVSLSVPETAFARALDLKDVKSQLAQTATKNELNALGQLKFEGQYDTLNLLQSAYPTGKSGLFLVIADGFTYRWDGGAWVRGVQFQSTGIAKNSIAVENLDSEMHKVIDARDKNLLNAFSEFGTVALATATNTYGIINWFRNPNSKIYKVKIRTKSYSQIVSYIFTIRNSNATILATTPVKSSGVIDASGYEIINIEFPEGVTIDTESFYVKMQSITTSCFVSWYPPNTLNSIDCVANSTNTNKQIVEPSNTAIGFSVSPVNGYYMDIQFIGKRVALIIDSKDITENIDKSQLKIDLEKTNNVGFYMPKNIYLLKGIKSIRRIPIENIISGYSKKLYMLTETNTPGSFFSAQYNTFRDGHVRKSGTTSASNKIFNLANVNDWTTIKQAAEYNWIVVDHNTKKSPNSNRNILCIGDSFTNQGYLPWWIRNMIVETCGISNFTFIGTKDFDYQGKNVKHCGYAGYSVKDFIKTDNNGGRGSSFPNPMLSAGNVALANMLSTIPDVIVLELGINDLLNFYYNTTELMNDLKVLINILKQSNPNVLIYCVGYVHLAEFCPTTQPDWHNMRIQQANSELEKLCESLTNCKYINTSILFNPQIGYNFTEVEVYPGSTQKEIEITDFLHPSNIGYKMMSEPIAAKIINDLENA